MQRFLSGKKVEPQNNIFSQPLPQPLMVHVECLLPFLPLVVKKKKQQLVTKGLPVKNEYRSRQSMGWIKPQARVVERSDLQVEMGCVISVVNTLVLILSFSDGEHTATV